ncbi:MAG: aryl-sulfate sulfotransferase, partial [Bryobacteraceae bacterium]
TAIPFVLPSSAMEGVTLLEPLYNSVYAVDSNSSLLWYLPGSYYYGTRAVPGGTFLVIYGDLQQLAVSGFREYDLAGNIVKDTNVEQVNALLQNLGADFTITCFHHDVRRLDNGNYLMLAQTEQLSDAQGPGLDILGDVVLLMDNNLQVLWTWNSFDHLDVTRKAVLGETCPTFVPGCVGFLASVANDWTHSNSVSVTPDGNIIVSSRHQDFVYKIAFQNGAGNGHVIWKLGKDGDFTWYSGDPYPWQSHQHDAEFESATLMTLYDNGNTRVQSFGGNSRGMALQIDEVNLTVTPILSADLEGYSAALGAAQKLLNGNYSFDSGIVGGGAQSIEVDGTGSIVSRIAVVGFAVYRTFRLPNLYSAPLPSRMGLPPRRSTIGASE